MTHIVVNDWSDVDGAPSVSGRDKERVADLFRNTDWDHVVWFADWLLDDSDKDIATVESSDNLAVGVCENYSEKAVRFFQPQRKAESSDPGGYAPKTHVVWFQRGNQLETVETPQRGLHDFSAGP